MAGQAPVGRLFFWQATCNFFSALGAASGHHEPNSFPARLSGMHTLKAVIGNGTPVAAKRRKKNKAAAVVAAPLCSAHATSAVRPGGAEKTVKKKKKKMRKKKSAMGGTGLVSAAAFSSAIEPVAVAAVAAKVAAVVDPNPVDTIFADGQARKAKRDAQKIKLEEQEAQEALVKEAGTMARRPSHSRVVDPIFFEEYDPAEKIDPQRAQVHRVRRRAKSGVPI